MDDHNFAIDTRAGSKQLVAIDFGSSSIKLLYALGDQTSENQELYVQSVANSASQGLRKGVIINVDATCESIKRALNDASQLALQEIKSCVVGLSGAHLQSCNSHGVAKVAHSEIFPEDIKVANESARAVALSPDYHVIGVTSQGYTVDGNAQVKAPLGMMAVRLESNVHIISAHNTSVSNMVRCLNRAGCRVEDLVPISIASAYAVTSAEERDQGIMVIDIGAGTADLSIFYDGYVQHSASLPYGGNQITKDLASNLIVSVSSAENLKCNAACASVRQVKQEQRIEVQHLNKQMSKIVSLNEIAGIVEARLQNIFELIKQEVAKSAWQGIPVGGVVITGGSARLKGIAEYAENVFSSAVRIGVPQDLQGLKDFANSPEYSACVGIARQRIYYPELFLDSQTHLHRSSAQKVMQWIRNNF